MALYSLKLKAYKFNVLKFHQDVSSNKSDTLPAVGQAPSNEDIITGLFKAYDTLDIALSKEHVRNLKSEYNKGHFTTISKELMLKIKTKYDKLSTEKRWKVDKQVIALNTLLERMNNSPNDTPNTQLETRRSMTKLLDPMIPAPRALTKTTRQTNGVMVQGTEARACGASTHL
jgi:hypothetical protein